MSSSSSRTYRAYCFDAARKVVSAEWLNATNDEEAIAEAEAAGFGSQCEVWEATRLIAQLGFENQSVRVH